MFLAMRGKLLPVLLVLVLADNVSGHGLIQSPGARNHFCGNVTKPDEVTNGTAEYPVCGGAFAGDPNGGYQFMSVLTHAEGRAVVSPLPQHVCGFGSETWNGGQTPWDVPIDWPTNSMVEGRQKFTWNISWGPHFSDTSDFRYWITKPGFQFQVGQALNWDDFENSAFCSLSYNDDTPNANPDVVPDPGNSLFHTYCNVPQRSGRHVIYAEWGREPPTYERFHGCIDVVFGDNDGGGGDGDGGDDGGGDDGGGDNTGSCEYVVQQEWNNGFVGAIRITNHGSSAIDGWEVSWEYSDGSTVTNGWNAALSGSNPYHASNVDWNRVIEPGQTLEFGFQGQKGAATIQIPMVSGSVCD